MDAKLLSRPGMDEAELAGMERLPGYLFPGTAVQVISQQRAADRCQVDSYLMCPAGFQGQGKQ